MFKIILYIHITTRYLLSIHCHSKH